MVVTRPSLRLAPSRQLPFTKSNTDTTFGVTFAVDVTAGAVVTDGTAPVVTDVTVAGAELRCTVVVAAVAPGVTLGDTDAVGALDATVVVVMVAASRSSEGRSSCPRAK